MNAFDQKKASILAGINGNSVDTPDLSPKGTIDRRCWPIMDTINSFPDMVTTSSCSGRVSVFLEGKKTTTQIGAKGNEGRWLFVTHEPEELESWHKAVDFCYAQDLEVSELNFSHSTRYVLFKFEPLILHVKCRDFKSASRLFSTAMACGFRESGIGSNLVVGIRTSIKLDVPIGYLRGEQILASVSGSYLDMITRLAADRFAENFRKLEVLEEAVRCIQEQKEIRVETKEERRLRKMNEGMERRERVRAEKAHKKAEKAKMAEMGGNVGESETKK